MRMHPPQNWLDNVIPQGWKDVPKKGIMMAVT
jgi:hypothetical protein